MSVMPRQTVESGAALHEICAASARQAIAARARSLLAGNRATVCQMDAASGGRGVTIVDVKPIAQSSGNLAGVADGQGGGIAIQAYAADTPENGTAIRHLDGKGQGRLALNDDSSVRTGDAAGVRQVGPGFCQKMDGIKVTRNPAAVDLGESLGPDKAQGVCPGRSQPPSP